MKFHYVEDDTFDITALQRKFRSCENLALTVSQSVDEMVDFIGDNTISGILLDIHRPDASSIEDDVARARRLTSAPIAFVTGGEVGDFRRRAIAAGAEGVLEKGGLTGELVRQTFCNAQERLSPQNSDEDRSLMNAPLSPQVSSSLEYLKKNLEAITTTALDRRQNIPCFSVLNALDILNIIKKQSVSGRDEPSYLPTTHILSLLDEKVKMTAALNEVTVSYGDPFLGCSEIGENDIQSLGLQHLVLSLLEHARPHTSIYISRDHTSPNEIASIKCSDPISFSEMYWSQPTDNLYRNTNFDQEVNKQISIQCFLHSGAIIEIKKDNSSGEYLLLRNNSN